MSLPKPFAEIGKPAEPLSVNLAIAASSFISGDTSVTSEALAPYGNAIVDFEEYCV